MHLVRTDNLQPRYNVCLFTVQPPAEADEIAEREDLFCEEVGRDNRADVRPKGRSYMASPRRAGCGFQAKRRDDRDRRGDAADSVGSSRYLRSIDLG